MNQPGTPGPVIFRRSIGQHALTVNFAAGERLKTGGSCDGTGGVVFIGAEKESRSFPVTPAPHCPAP